MRHCVFDEKLLSMTMIPFQYEKMIIPKRLLKVKSELAFPIVLCNTIYRILNLF